MLVHVMILITYNPGYPNTSTTEEKNETVKKMILDNRRITI